MVGQHGPESTIPKRAIIYPKDVQRITGRSESYARKLLQKIKERYSKEDHQYVTLEEFAQYTGLSVEVVVAFIVD